MHPQLGTVANVFDPSDSDWVVSVRYRDGVVRNRRVTPGRISEQQAIDFALVAERRKIEEVEWMAVRRAGDRTIEPTGPDLFLDRMRRMRT